MLVGLWFFFYSIVFQHNKACFPFCLTTICWFNTFGVNQNHVLLIASSASLLAAQKLQKAYNSIKECWSPLFSHNPALLHWIRWHGDQMLVRMMIVTSDSLHVMLLHCYKWPCIYHASSNNHCIWASNASTNMHLVDQLNEMITLREVPVEIMLMVKNISLSRQDWFWSYSWWFWS
jgi:hypothetical protein